MPKKWASDVKLSYVLKKGQYNPSLKLAMDIAKVFGVSVEDIFSFEDE